MNLDLLLITHIFRKMVHCVWGLCSNNDKYNKVTCKRPRSDYVGTTWIPWPKDTQQLQNWINACGTENLRKPTDVSIFVIMR